MGVCYFDTSVFLAVLNGEPTAAGVRALLRELRRDKTKIYTSILTIQEASVAAIRAGSPADSLHSEISKFARVQTITREIAVTSAHLEAEILKKMNKSDLSEEERIGNNRRRKWDCFHIATALELHVSVRFWPYRQLAFSDSRLPCERYGCSCGSGPIPETVAKNKGGEASHCRSHVCPGSFDCPSGP